MLKTIVEVEKKTESNLHKDDVENCRGGRKEKTETHFEEDYVENQDWFQEISDSRRETIS